MIVMLEVGEGRDVLLRYFFIDFKPHSLFFSKKGNLIVMIH